MVEYPRVFHHAGFFFGWREAVKRQTAEALLNDALQRQTQRARGTPAEDRADFRKLFTSRETFINPDLAKLYRVKIMDGGFSKVVLPEERVESNCDLVALVILEVLTQLPVEPSVCDSVAPDDHPMV